MKPSLPSSQHGQTLVLIALAAVVLFAFAALAIDGSAVFSDRRHSQNASDTAALAAALALTRDPTSNWVQTGKDRALSNGYDESDGITKVYVHLCSTTVVTDEGITLTCQGLPAGADPSEYVHVYIKSVVKLFFARVIGWGQIINHTDAVVHAAPIEVTEWFDGMAIVSAKKGCPVPGDNSVPFVIGGNANINVNNSGIFVNSSCEPAIKDDGGGSSNIVTTTGGLCVYGGVPGEGGLSGDVDGVTPPPDDHCGTQVDMSQYWMPYPEQFGYCTDPGSINPDGTGNYIATPGYFNNTGNQTFPDASPAAILKLEKGVYCLYNGISLNGNWTLTTDLDGDGHDPDSEGVFFYIPDGDVTFNGGSTLNVHAMDDTAGGFPTELLHYLMFIPPTNESTVTISGNNGSTFTGTILAPASHVTLDGSGNAFSLNTQIISYDTTVTGGGHIDITYDPDEQAPAVIPPNISQTE